MSPRPLIRWSRSAQPISRPWALAPRAIGRVCQALDLPCPARRARAAAGSRALPACRRHGVDHLPARRGAGLHHRLLRALPDRTHDDAETVAAVLAGALDWHMATRVAELARAGRRPPASPARSAAPPPEWHENQHARWPVVAPAAPARFPGGVWRPAMKDRKGRERYEGYCTPVTYDPTPRSRWPPRGAITSPGGPQVHEVRERLHRSAGPARPRADRRHAAGVSQLRRSGRVTSWAACQPCGPERSFGRCQLGERHAFLQAERVRFRLQGELRWVKQARNAASYFSMI